MRQGRSKWTDDYEWLIEKDKEGVVIEYIKGLYNIYIETKETQENSCLS